MPVKNSCGATAFTEHLLGLWPLASPLVWLTGHPVAAYNIVFVLTFPLSALAMFALVRALTGSTAGGLIGGLAFAFAPYRASQLSHLQMLAAYGMPIALLGLHRFRQTGGILPLLLFGAGWLVTVLTNSYMLVFFGVYVTCWALWFCTGRESRQRLPGIAAAGVVSLAVLVPIFAEYVAVHDRYGFTRGREEIVGYSADVTGLAHPWPGMPVSSAWLEPVRGEGALFPGVVIILLAAAAVALTMLRRSGSRPATRSAVGFYAAMAVVTWVLSLGPTARLGGVEIASSLPYDWLLAVPGVSGIRVPARFFLLTTLSLAMLAGCGAAALVRLRGGVAVAAGAAALVVAEGWMPVAAAPVQARSPLAAQEAGGAVLDLPFDEAPFDAAPQMLRAVTGGYRTLNGHSGYEPAHVAPLRAGLSLGEGAILTELRRRLPLLVAVPADGGDGWRRWLLTTHPDAELVAEAGGRALYRLAPLERAEAPPRGAPVPFAIETASCATEPAAYAADGSLATRWHCGTAQPGQSITVRLERSTAVSGVVIDPGPQRTDLPRSLLIEVSRDGQAWTDVWSNLPASAAVAAALDDPERPAVPLVFPAVPAQYVRLTQTGDAWGWYWSLAELQILSSGDAAR